MAVNKTTSIQPTGKVSDRKSNKKVIKCAHPRTSVTLITWYSSAGGRKWRDCGTGTMAGAFLVLAIRVRLIPSSIVGACFSACACASPSSTGPGAAGITGRWKRLGKKSAESNPSRRMSSTRMSRNALWLRWLMMLWCAHGRWAGSVWRVLSVVPGVSPVVGLHTSQEMHARSLTDPVLQQGVEAIGHFARHHQVAHLLLPHALHQRGADHLEWMDGWTRDMLLFHPLYCGGDTMQVSSLSCCASIGSNPHPQHARTLDAANPSGDVSGQTHSIPCATCAGSAVAQARRDCKAASAAVEDCSGSAWFCVWCVWLVGGVT